MENHSSNSNNPHPQVGSKRPLSETISQQPAQQQGTAAPAATPAAAAAVVPVASTDSPSANGAPSASGTDTAGSAAAAAPAPSDAKHNKHHGSAAYGPDMQVLEVTNNGDPANMEMLIHLKVCVLVGVGV